MAYSKAKVGKLPQIHLRYIKTYFMLHANVSIRCIPTHLSMHILIRMMGSNAEVGRLCNWKELLDKISFWNFPISRSFQLHDCLWCRSNMRWRIRDHWSLLKLTHRIIILCEYDDFEKISDFISIEDICLTEFRCPNDWYFNRDQKNY